MFTLENLQTLSGVFALFASMALVQFTLGFFHFAREADELSEEGVGGRVVQDKKIERDRLKRRALQSFCVMALSGVAWATIHLYHLHS